MLGAGGLIAGAVHVEPADGGDSAARVGGRDEGSHAVRTPSGPTPVSDAVGDFRRVLGDGGHLEAGLVEAEGRAGGADGDGAVAGHVDGEGCRSRREHRQECHLRPRDRA